jgi:hypothetical protein
VQTNRLAELSREAKGGYAMQLLWDIKGSLLDLKQLYRKSVAENKI